MRYWPMVSEVFMLPGASYHALPPRVKAHDFGVLRLVAAFSRGGLFRRAAAPFSARRKSAMSAFGGDKSPAESGDKSPHSKSRPANQLRREPTHQHQRRQDDPVVTAAVGAGVVIADHREHDRKD